MRNNAAWAASGAALAIDTSGYSGGTGTWTFMSALVDPDGSHSIGLVKTGGTSSLSTLALHAQETYTGATTVNAGTLQIIGGDNRLPTGTAVTLANFSGATLDLNSFNQTIGSLAGGGTAGGNVTLGVGTLTVGNATNTAFAGIISGLGGLTKAGSGNQTLSGANSYAGLTTVNGKDGVLTLTGTSTATPIAWAPVLTGGGANIQSGKLVFDYTGGDRPAVDDRRAGDG